jgi:hypothetical protein
MKINLPKIHMSVISQRKKAHLVELCDKLGVPLALFPKQVVLLLLEAE